jgi:hypothetical protein
MKGQGEYISIGDMKGIAARKEGEEGEGEEKGKGRKVVPYLLKEEDILERRDTIPKNKAARTLNQVR